MINRVMLFETLAVNNLTWFVPKRDKWLILDRKVMVTARFYKIVLLSVCFVLSTDSSLFNVVGGVQAFCPQHCKCVIEGASGVEAHCTELNADEQFFLKPVQHLTMVNENKKSTALAANVFVKLGLKSVESIKIVNSSLVDIDVNAFDGLVNLFDVNLADNRLFLIHPETFANNTNLRHLKLTGNQLQLTQLLHTPYDHLLRSKSLTEFDISFCQLSQIFPTTFSQMRNLIFLNLSWNFLKVVPADALKDLSYLEELDLSHNLIKSIGRENFARNPELSVLKLKKNPIDFMNGISAPRLEELDMSECKLTLMMRECLDGMPQLLHLNFSRNKIEIMSEDTFYDLLHLKHLDLSHNEFYGPLPVGIFKQNTELETLSLTGNSNLKTLVASDGGFAGNHPALIRLDVSSCGLTWLNGTPFAGMTGLTILTLSNNAITYVSDSAFRNLTRLTQLDLSNNRLQSLPASLFNDNVQLVKLSLSGNPLLELPTLALYNLPNLKLLDVSNCQLLVLWDKHYRQWTHRRNNALLPNLAVLDLSGNNLQNLHMEDFTNFTKLEKIDLSRNPLECIRPTIDVIHWLKDRQVDPYYGQESSVVNVAVDNDVVAVKTSVEQQFRWNQLITDICPVKVTDAEESEVHLPPKDEEDPTSKWSSSQQSAVDADDDVSPQTPSKRRHESRAATTYLHEKIIVEDDGETIIWQAIFVTVVILVVIYLIVYFVGEIANRRRCGTSAYIKPGTLGGHLRGSRGTNGAPLYYKLYEECSIPTNESENKKRSIFIGFAPIHTLLKKGTYKIMKNNEVHL